MITIGGITIYDFVVALTDLLLCIESIGLAYLLYKQKSNEMKLQWLFYGLFICLAISSLFGSIFHGFFPDKTATSAGFIVWLITALSIGGAASICLYIDGLISRSKKIIRYIQPISILYAFIFAGVILIIDYHFQTVLIFYMPPILLMAIIALRRYLSSYKKTWLYLVAGISLSFVAAAIQYFQISLNAVYFNYNAFYHLVQGVALLLIFISFRFILKLGNEKI